MLHLFALKEYPQWLEDALVGSFVEGSYLIKEIFATYDSGFGIYGAEDENGESFTLTGSFSPFLSAGSTYAVKGKVNEYKSEKKVMGFVAYPTKPQTKAGILAYLRTLKGLKTRADLLYETYGNNVIDMLLNNPEEVVKSISGIGKKSVENWKQQLEVLKDNQASLLALYEMGIKPKQVKILLETYGDNIIDEIKNNPYILSRKIQGYGFIKCDQIARHTGLALNSYERIQAAIMYTLESGINNGHCFLPKHELIKTLTPLLQVHLTEEELRMASDHNETESLITIGEGTIKILLKKEQVSYAIRTFGQNKNYKGLTINLITKERMLEEIDRMIGFHFLVGQEDRIYLKKWFNIELSAAQNIHRLLHGKKKSFNSVDEDLLKYEKEHEIHLEAEQRKAVTSFASTEGGIEILNGSAGCGKTFTLNVLLAIAEKRFMIKNRTIPKIHVFAPTGRAAKVAQKSTKRKAMTLHRGLKYSEENGFEFCRENKLDADIVVVDEVSMLDIELLNSLLEALPTGCKLILIGDIKQLPSVGPGRVLWDLIESNIIPVVTLTVEKRQAADSGIIQNANNIINGLMIESRETLADAYVMARKDVYAMQATLIKSFERLLELGYDMNEIQVLAPMKKGEAGVFVLNYILQQAFNPLPCDHKILNRMVWKEYKGMNPTEVSLYFKKGDKVIHTSNNYDLPWYTQTTEGKMVQKRELGVMNGEVGRIHHITANASIGSLKEYCIWVKYEDGFVCYNNDFSELDHAFALTIHKSQGSQWDAVLQPTMMEHYRMLDNSIFYTGYTRAKKFHATIGEIEAIGRAIRTKNSGKRHTWLKKQLISDSLGLAE